MYVKCMFNWLSLVISLMMSLMMPTFVLPCFPRDVLDEILD